jgi:hypothetical protein
MTATKPRPAQASVAWTAKLGGLTLAVILSDH